MNFINWKNSSATFSFLGILLLLSTAAQAQVKVRGTVVDSLGQGLPGANIVFRSKVDSAIAGFAHTDEEGGFALALPEANLFAQVSMVGFLTREIPLSFKDGGNEYLEITLSENTKELEEAVVEGKAPPIIQKNDTTEFDAATFSTEGDEKAVDLLKKLPGMEVREGGKIYFRGKRIKDMLIEGESLFSKSPETISKAFPAGAIDKVQVLGDYSEFGDMSNSSNNYAINLTIQDDKKNVIFGSVQAGAGRQENQAAYQGKADLFWIRKKIKALWISDLNNISNQTFGMSEYLQFVGGVFNMRSSELAQLPIGGSDFERRPQNDAAFGALSIAYRPSEQVRLQSYALLNRDKGLNIYRVRREFATELNNEIYQSSKEYESLRQLFAWSTTFQYVPNNKHTLKAELYFAPSLLESQEDNQQSFAGFSNTASSSSANEQGRNELSLEYLYSGDKGSWYASASAHYQPNNHSYQLHSNSPLFITGNSKDQWPIINQLEERSQGDLWKYQALVRHARRLSEYWSLEVSSEHKSESSSLEYIWDSTEHLPDSLDQSYQDNRSESHLSTQLRLERGIIDWKIGAKLAHYRLGFQDEQGHENMRNTIVEPETSIRLSLPWSQSLLLSYTLGNSYAAPNQLNRAYRIEGAEQLTAGLDQAHRIMPSHQWRFQYNMNNLYSKVFVTLFARYERLPSAISTQQSIGLMSINRLVQLPSTRKQAFLSVSKTFSGDFASTMKASANLSGREGENFVNGQKNTFQSTSRISTLSFRTHHQKAVNFGASWNYQWLKYSSEALRSKSHIHKIELQVDYKVSRLIFYSLQPQSLFLKQAGNSQQFFLLNSSLRFKFHKKWKLRIQGFNLGNSQRMEEVSVQDTYEQAQLREILGRYVLASIEYSF